MQKELREKKAELGRCYQLSPGGVELQIREYNHELAKIDSQLAEMEKQDLAQTRKIEGDCQRPEGIGNRLAEYDGLYVTPEGQQQERSRDGRRDR